MKKPSATRQIREQIKELTVHQFRQHLKNDLRDLPLPKEICRPLLDFFAKWPEPFWIPPTEEKDIPRQLILNFLGDVPTDDDRFWGGLGMAEQIERENPKNPALTAAQAAAEYFSGRDGNFEKHHDVPPPPHWQEPAARVLLVLDTLRAGATLATKKGAPEKIPRGEKAARKRAQDTEAQQRLSGRDYRVGWQAAYQKRARALEAKGKATAKNLRALAKHIIAAETPTRKAPVKRQGLDDFARWAEEDINQRTLRKNSR